MLAVASVFDVIYVARFVVVLPLVSIVPAPHLACSDVCVLCLCCCCCSGAVLSTSFTLPAGAASVHTVTTHTDASSGSQITTKSAASHSGVVSVDDTGSAAVAVSSSTSSTSGSGDGQVITPAGSGTLPSSNPLTSTSTLLAIGGGVCAIVGVVVGAAVYMSRRRRLTKASNVSPLTRVVAERGRRVRRNGAATPMQAAGAIDAPAPRRRAAAAASGDATAVGRSGSAFADAATGAASGVVASTGSDALPAAPSSLPRRASSASRQVARLVDGSISVAEVTVPRRSTRAKTPRASSSTSGAGGDGGQGHGAAGGGVRGAASPPSVVMSRKGKDGGGGSGRARKHRDGKHSSKSGSSS